MTRELSREAGSQPGGDTRQSGTLGRGTAETAEGKAALLSPQLPEVSSVTDQRETSGSAPKAVGSPQKDRSDHLKRDVRPMALEPEVNGLCPVNAPSFIHSFNKCLLIARLCASIQDRTKPCLLLVGGQTPR